MAVECHARMCSPCWAVSPMTDHDPLCSPDSLYGDDPEDEFCHCELVALVRADEVTQRYGWVSREDAVTQIEAEVRERIAQDIEADRAHMADAMSLCVGTQDAYNRAARIARGGAQ